MKPIHILICALLLATPVVAESKTITVTTTVDEADGSCTDGDCSFRDAVTVAVSGDTISIPQGTYRISPRQESFPRINVSELTITGAGSGHTVITGHGESADFFNLSPVNGGTLKLSKLTVTEMYGGVFGVSVFTAGSGSTLILENCVVSDSYASKGAAVGNYSGTVIINSCAFVNNRAKIGGAIYIKEGQTEIVNTLIAGNTLDYRSGAAIYINGYEPAEVLIRSSTIVNNDAPYNEIGGIFIESDVSHVVHIANSIVGFNFGMNCSPGIISLGHNIDSGDSCGFTAIGDIQRAHPALMPLETIDGMLVRIPQSNSPALDNGSLQPVDGVPSACPDSDQRGLARPQGGRCDIGAVEVEVEGEYARILVIPAYDFGGGGDNVILNDGYNRYTTNGAPLIAPVQLPTGALITAIAIQGCVYDTDSTLTFTLSEGNVDGSSTPLTGIHIRYKTPFSDCRLYFVGLENFPYPPHTVDNLHHTYYMEIGTEPGATVGAARVYYRLQISPPSAVATFNDVPGSDPFFKSVEALATSGITGGCGGGNFCPDAVVTREQMAAFLARALGLHWP